MKMIWCDYVPIFYSVVTAQVIASSDGLLTAGQNGFSLTCNVSGTGNLNLPTFNYQWKKGGGIIPGQQGRTLSLSPLNVSTAGQYMCEVTVISLSGPFNSAVISNIQDTRIQCMVENGYEKHRLCPFFLKCSTN